jgi:hypothetical protein
MNRKIIGVFNRDTQIDEIRKIINDLPCDAIYKIRLGKILIGTIFESYHWNLLYEQNSKNATLSTNYNLSATIHTNQKDKILYKDFIDVDKAKQFILGFIPEACRKYAKIQRKIIKDDH